MAWASNADVLNLKKRNPMGCIPINNLLQSNCPHVNLSLSYLSYDKAGFSAVLKFSTSRNFETFSDICTFRQVDPTKPYQDQLSEAYPEKTLNPFKPFLPFKNLSKETSAVNDSISKRKPTVKSVSSNNTQLSEETGLTGKSCLSFPKDIESNGKIPVPIDVPEYMDPEKTLASTENLSKETSAVNYSRSNRKPTVKSTSSNGNQLGEETGLTGKSCLSFSPEIGSNGKIPVPIDFSKLMDPEKTLTPTKKLSEETSCRKYSRHTRKLRVHSRPKRKPTVKSVSSNGNPLGEETRFIGKRCLSFSQEIGSNGKIPVPIDVSKSMDPEKTLPPTENLSEEISAVNYSRSKRKPTVKSVSSNINPLGEETRFTGKSCLSFSQESGSNGKILVPIDVSKSMDVTKFLISNSDTKLNPSVLDNDIKVLNTKKVFPVEFSFDKPNFETHTSLFIPENIKNPEFQHGEKSKQEVNLGHFVSMSTIEPYDDNAITCSTSSNNLLLSKNSNNPLKEILPVLEDWARRGLDTVFNRPLKFSSEEIGTNLKNDLKYGLDVMKEITTRMYTLMRVADQLPDIDPKLIPGFSRIQVDFNLNLMEMWNIIDDIILQVYDDYKNIKLCSDNVSGESSEDMKQEANPNVFITNAYIVVIEKLPLLRKQLVDIREKVRMICSEVEKLL